MLVKGKAVIERSYNSDEKIKFIYELIDIRDYVPSKHNGEIARRIRKQIRYQEACEDFNIVNLSWSAIPQI